MIATTTSLSLDWKGRTSSLDAELPRALEGFFKLHEHKAYRIAHLMLSDRDDALDCVQEAMTRLVRSYSRRPPEEWAPLFYRILHNAVHDVLRHRRRRRFFSLQDAGATEDEDPRETIADTSGPDPYELCARREFRQRLSHALARLPRRQREAFTLRLLAEESVATTARSMGCSEGSVKTHLSRALAALRREFEADAATP